MKSEHTLIPIVPETFRQPMPRGPEGHPAPTQPPSDVRGRPLHDLRISVTDRCNFRCTYCMPREVFDKNHHYLPRQELLSFEEIERTARIFVGLGVRKIRLTGGEPLLRHGIEVLIEKLAQLPAEITLTTNGVLLQRKAQALKDAGLDRITVSLDALNDVTFKRINDADYPVSGVLEGIEAAQAAGFENIKINCVVQRSVNEQEILPLARHFRHSGHILRFIEFMDVGCSNGWALDSVVPAAEILRMIGDVFPLEPLDANHPGEVAQRWRYQDGGGEIGVISSVTRTFCHECSRLRLSIEGMLFTCLFAQQGYDFRSLLRTRHSDEFLTRSIQALWQQRADHYSEIRHSLTPGLRKIEMSYIGG